MFESLGDKLQGALKSLTGRGKLTEEDVDRALREVRLALLEADVNFLVAKKFTESVRQRAVGTEVMESLTPGQQVVKIVHDELTQLMGGSEHRLNFSSQPPTVIMLAGLQGSGKTTTCAKLARYLKRQGRNPLLAAADIYRPAAGDQLAQLGDQIDVPVLDMSSSAQPEDIARAAVSKARSSGSDTVLLDTAGRLHIDEEMMEELSAVENAVDVHESLLIVDAMTGQDAVNVAEEFSERIEITGLVLTKMDGDTRGGAALSVLDVTGCPVKFVGTGERPDDLQTFHPDRMASRILGMGDVMTLVEKAEQEMDEEQARRLEQRLREDKFTLEDFLEQMQQVRQMGPLDQLVSMIPGMSPHADSMGDLDEAELVKAEAIIQSMTPEERRSPDIIKRSRRRRIARGSGTRVQDVNRLLKQFSRTRDMISQLTKGQKSQAAQKLRNMGFPRR